MPRFREVIKRYIPKFLHTIVVRGRDILAAPPMEDIALHDYVFVADPGTRPRLSLVIPSVSPATAFGGILTGIEIVLQIGALAGVEIRIIVDHFDGCPEPNVVEFLRATARAAPDRDRDPAQDGVGAAYPGAGRRGVLHLRLLDHV